MRTFQPIRHCNDFPIQPIEICTHRAGSEVVQAGINPLEVSGEETMPVLGEGYLVDIPVQLGHSLFDKIFEGPACTIRIVDHGSVWLALV